MEREQAPEHTNAETQRARYDEQWSAVRLRFESSMREPGAGERAVAARSALVDEVVGRLWADLLGEHGELATGIALIAVGGYGRGELFPYSDVDLMVLVGVKGSERVFKEPIRKLNQRLWDVGLRVSAMTRTLAECERFDPENVEFTLSLLDARALQGDAALIRKLWENALPKLLARERKRVAARLLEVTERRHAKYGETLFHLEPNLKECPGGLRDAHVCHWLARLREQDGAAPTVAFVEARRFLVLVRVFLHLRHGRDNNTLDWQAQDEAAAVPLGMAVSAPGERTGAGWVPRPDARPDAAYWMRLYFRHARVVERSARQAQEEALPAATGGRRPLLAALRGLPAEQAHRGFVVRGNRVDFSGSEAAAEQAAHEPDVVLAIFAAVAATGATLARSAETRMEEALPLLSAHLEDGPKLWKQLEAILTRPYAGAALRAMHTLGVLELILPEFHGIDALVIRDAYHRYTVDEHTFVLIDTLHRLGEQEQGKPATEAGLAGLLRDLPHPSLLYLAALLHDTGKGHATEGHAQESGRMARNVLSRLELDSYESALVLDLIQNHLEMSAALRRDVFDSETIRAFAARVQTPEALRMLTLFTFADICAVHPDALTPWKAENLWRLHLATATFLDRHVDDERVAFAPASSLHELVESIRARHPRRLAPELQAEIALYLEGFPKRYLQTRTADEIRTHLEMAQRLAEDAVQLSLNFNPAASTITLITRDRPMLFAAMAGALAAWGMNIQTADAFSNAHGLVVDSFRFTDTFRTLELNESERVRFVQSVHEVLTGAVAVEALLAARRRGQRTTPKTAITTRVDIDDTASQHSTLIEVVARDTPGLLRVLALAIAEHGANIEVALVDTEGEMAIDVFYLTRQGVRLTEDEAALLRRSLLVAVEEHAR